MKYYDMGSLVADPLWELECEQKGKGNLRVEGRVVKGLSKACCQRFVTGLSQGFIVYIYIYILYRLICSCTCILAHVLLVLVHVC